MYNSEGIAYAGRYDCDDLGSVTLYFKVAARKTRELINKLAPEKDTELAVEFPSERLIDTPYGSVEVLSGGMWRNATVSEGVMNKLLNAYYAREEEMK